MQEAPYQCYWRDRAFKAEKIADELTKVVGIIALSANPEPPKFKGGQVMPQYSYSAPQHEACVDRCQSAIRDLDLWNWKDSRGPSPA